MARRMRLSVQETLTIAFEQALSLGEIVWPPDIEPHAIVMVAADIGIRSAHLQQQRRHIQVFILADIGANRLALKDVDAHADIVQARRLLAIGTKPVLRIELDQTEID